MKFFKNKKRVTTILLAIAAGTVMIYVAGGLSLQKLKGSYLYQPPCVFPYVAARGTCLPPQAPPAKDPGDLLAECLKDTLEMQKQVSDLGKKLEDLELKIALLMSEYTNPAPGGLGWSDVLEKLDGERTTILQTIKTVETKIQKFEDECRLRYNQHSEENVPTEQEYPSVIIPKHSTTTSPSYESRYR